jgi:hypothetical protein
MDADPRGPPAKTRFQLEGSHACQQKIRLGQRRGNAAIVYRQVRTTGSEANSGDPNRRAQAITITCIMSSIVDGTNLNPQKTASFRPRQVQLFQFSSKPYQVP